MSRIPARIPALRPRILPDISRHQNRSFFALLPGHYDGVYKELGDMKLQKPWLQVLEDQKQKAAVQTPPKSPEWPLSQKDLPPKRMQDSYHKIVLPLAEDPWLVDGYVNSGGRLRIGTLFQDLDALAGVIAYKYTGPGPTMVTAAVDRISIIHPMKEWCNLQLSGFVSHVGTSSMEIAMEARRLKKDGSPVEGQEGVLLTCDFTFVARDPVSNKAVPVNPLQLETGDEKAVFKKADELRKKKKSLAKLDLMKQTPNDEESDLIHNMWLDLQHYQDPQNTASIPSDTVYMSSTTIQSTSIMQPQLRNVHNSIFGGYLLRLTMELAFSCCSAFANTRPRFVSLDPSTFQAPVPIGSILYLTATVAYTEPTSKGSRVQVRVESRVRGVEDGKVDNTGVFNYTFFIDKKAKVMPVTYTEFIKYIEARRRAKQQNLVAETMDDGTLDRVTE